MTMQHLTPKDYITTKWSGGLTTQLGIAPEGAVYADRDFLWRLSSATVEDAESDFTALPDYERLISTLEGTIELNHNGGEKLTLNPYEVHRFDGGDSTHSWGCCRDFNLMLRKGKCEGRMRGETLAAGESKTVHGSEGMMLIYCGAGEVEVVAGEESIALKAGEAVRLDGFAGEVTLCSRSGAKLMLAKAKEI